jgi:hypothetical protein
MFTCSEKTACVSSWGPAMMRILLNAYQHDYVYDCPEIIKQYTDEYTDNNSGFAQFKELFLERGAETDYCDLKSIRATWNSLKRGRWGDYDICDQNMPKILEMKEGFPTVLRTNYEPRKKVQGVNVRSVFMGWKMRTEPSMPSNNVDVDDIHFVDETD